MYRFVRVGVRMAKYLGFGTGASATYLGFQYNQDFPGGAGKLLDINQENAQDVWRWVKWKCRNNILTAENNMADGCSWCSSMQWFHTLRIPSLLIHLANLNTVTTNTLFVKLLSAVRFPEGTDMKGLTQMCSPKVVIGLARTNDIDAKWFNCEECTKPIDEEDLERKMDKLIDTLHAVTGEGGCDPCAVWLVKKVIEQKLPPDPDEWVCPMNDLSTERDNVDFTQDKIDFSENIPTYLEIFQRHSMKRNIATNADIAEQLVEVLRLVCLKYSGDDSICVSAGNIMANLAVRKSNHSLLAHSGILDVLVGWRRGDSVALQLTAGRILHNVDMYDSSCICQLKDGIYTVHPDSRSDADIDVDVVFIHGIKGRWVDRS